MSMSWTDPPVFHPSGYRGDWPKGALRRRAVRVPSPACRRSPSPCASWTVNLRANRWTRSVRMKPTFMADTSRRPSWRSGPFVLHVPGSRLGPVPPGAVALFGLLLRCFLSALLIGKLVALRVEQGGMVVGPVRAAARAGAAREPAPQTGQVLSLIIGLLSYVLGGTFPD